MVHAPKHEYTLVNATYWFEHELRQYPAVSLDIGALKAHADRIVLIAGRESRGYPTYEVNVELGKKLGRELIELPGGHVGFLTQPVAFAREFLQALAQTQRK
jgi:pimeloyl-ACP methyl ester carboxylesterase